MKRRNFLKCGAAAGGFSILPARVLFGDEKPSSVVQVGILGCGRMAQQHIRQLLAMPNVKITTVCDVDLNRVRTTRQTIFDALGDNQCSCLQGFQDVREFLLTGEMDAVVIAVPDFQHGYCAAACLAAGKDVYLEKPTTYTLEEGRLLLKLAREKKLVVQVGSQQRSLKQFHTACELVRAGRLGKLKQIKVGLPTEPGGGSTAEMPVPNTLDYDKWLGPLQPVFYTEDRAHPQADYGRPGWMRWEPADLGMVANWGAHHLDIAHWAMGGNVQPLKIDAKAEFLSGGLWNVHRTIDARLEYPGGVTVHVSNEHLNGVRFEGEEGWIFAARGNTVLPGKRVVKALDAASPALLAPLPEDKQILRHPGLNHMEDFIHSVQTRKPPIAPLEEGHVSNIACILTHAAFKTGKPLAWDAAAQTILNNAEAAELTAYKPRKEYSIHTLLQSV